MGHRFLVASGGVNSRAAAGLGTIRLLASRPCCASPVRPRGPGPRARADPLVRPDLPGGLRPVPVAGRAARASPGSPTPAGPGATSRTCCSTACWAWCSAGAWAMRCSTSRASTWPTRRDPDGVEGRHVLPRRAAGRDRRHGLFARARAQLPAGDGPGRALRAHRPGLGRIGNFINGELWGRAADPSLPWAMVFPQSGSAMARHPSQLYQLRWKACCCSCCCGGTGASRAPPARWRARSCRLRRLPLRRRVLPRARQLPGPAGAGHEHGPVAVRADDRGRRGAVGGPAPQRPRRSMPMRQIFLDTETTGLTPTTATASSRSAASRWSTGA
jgi:hypothetical protein